MFNSTFKIVYAILFFLAMVVRKVFTTKNRKMDFITHKISTGDIVLLFFDGIGMIIPLVYVFSNIFDFADYDLPDWIGWIGTGLFVFAIWVMYQSHAALGKNWTPVLAIQKEHTLITSGIYQYLRHPMYAAHILWAVAQMMMLHNWIAGYSFIVVMLPHYLVRVGWEEKMLRDHYGQEYLDYAERTGRIFPKLR